MLCFLDALAGSISFYSRQSHPLASGTCPRALVMSEEACSRVSLHFATRTSTTPWNRQCDQRRNPKDSWRSQRVVAIEKVGPFHERATRKTAPWGDISLCGLVTPFSFLYLLPSFTSWPPTVQAVIPGLNFKVRFSYFSLATQFFTSSTRHSWRLHPEICPSSYCQCTVTCLCTRWEDGMPIESLSYSLLHQRGDSADIKNKGHMAENENPIFSRIYLQLLWVHVKYRSRRWRQGGAGREKDRRKGEQERKTKPD